MKRKVFIGMSFVLLFTTQSVMAQENSDNLITGDFNNASFHEFVQKVEKQTNFHFYYDPSQFDSVSITISVKKAHLSSILDKVFNNTDWHFTIDKESQVFITKGFVLRRSSLWFF